MSRMFNTDSGCARFWAGTIVALTLILAISDNPIHGEPPTYDLSRDRVLYCVGYAHLDTQWRWDFPTTINKYILDTLDGNFERFGQFPEYVFNFTGSVRYEMMKEYYPEKYEKLKQFVAEGRWFVSGSSVDEGDVNVPSAEAVIRQVLYGNEFFRREFDRESLDFMLPDCFGFPASMPSIWAHCGLKGFSTQKLTWGSAAGIPFKIGVWEGLDGQSVIAALDPGPYVGAIKGRVDTNSEWIHRINENGRRYGVWADYPYYGVGDQGGAPREEDVRNYVESMTGADGGIKVALVSSDRMFRDITAEQRERLPRYRGDLLLTEHSAGTLTSQAYMKRWNRKGEILADAAERAAVASVWLGMRDYPMDKLNRSWVRLLANQMHDILPGTSIPRAYTYSWNDEILAMNGFASVLEDSVSAVSSAMDTRSEGMPLIVYNALAIEREDVVEATLPWPDLRKSFPSVFDHNGRRVPTQLVGRDKDRIRIAFLARTPPVSWSVFDVRGIPREEYEESPLRISDRDLENAHYVVRLNDEGDIVSIVDKQSKSRELLAAPARLVFTFERPAAWPAWNMDWADRSQPPIDFAKGPARMQVVEEGPVRVTLLVERKTRNSIIRQYISLARGDAGRRVEIRCDVDWQSAECALKASFPLTVQNPGATYNWGMGTIERGNNDPLKYEVPSHEWIDLTDKSGEYGVSILEDCKYGSDKPADNELRLTLLYTPGVRSGYRDQHSQDWGRHDFAYGLYGHGGDWRKAETEWQARRLNQPLRAWIAPAHPGELGKSHSLLEVSSTQIDIRAIKQAERSKHIIIRLQELWGREAKNVKIRSCGEILEAEEVDGQERRIGPAKSDGRNLLVDLEPYAPRTFAVRLASPPVLSEKPQCSFVALNYDTDVVSSDGDRADGAFGSESRTMPAEMFPQKLADDGVAFALGPVADGKSNAVACRGQTLQLPEENFTRLHILAAADEDVTARFKIGERESVLQVPAWTGFIGQWDDRVWDREFREVDHVCDGRVTQIKTGYIKRSDVAWFCTHRHHPQKGNEAYQFSHIFHFDLELLPGERTLQLPDDPRVKLFAATVARGDGDPLRATTPLYDDFTNRKPIQFRHVYPPPPTPVYDGLLASGSVRTERQIGFDSLEVERPSNSDYVDRARDAGLQFVCVDGAGRLRPHSQSGAVDRALPRLNDGVLARNDDDTQGCVWFDNEGRFFLDLKQEKPVSRVNAYSWHRADRARQWFSLWGASGEQMPNPEFKHGEHDRWKLLGVVDTRVLGEGGVHASMVQSSQGDMPLGRFRYLLWVAEDMGQGTFFTEIDVHLAD